MPSFNQTFDRPGTLAQAIDSERAVIGRAFVLGGLGFGGLVAACATTMAAAPVVAMGTVTAVAVAIGAKLIVDARAPRPRL